MHSGLAVTYLNEREDISVKIPTVEASAAIARRNEEAFALTGIGQPRCTNAAHGVHSMRPST